MVGEENKGENAASAGAAENQITIYTFGNLKSQMPDLDDGICYVAPVILDDVSVKLGPWSGYNVLAQNQGDFAFFRPEIPPRSFSAHQ